MSCRGETPTPPTLEEIGRSSPPPSCAICLGTYKNKSFTENCLHQFCFSCLLKWSKIKAECPLCKQPFKCIIHNVRSNESYDKYLVEQLDTRHEYDLYHPLRFQYSTTLTINTRDNNAIHRLLYGYPGNNSRHGDAIDLTRTNLSTRTTRRTIYQHNLWVQPLPDVHTGRFRDCSVAYYRNNPAQISRLVPWLNRELSVCANNPSNIIYVISRITELLTMHAITSRTFRDFISAYIHVNVDHFIHEFHSFARSPYDMIGYDRHFEYRYGSPYDIGHLNEILSSESDDSADSDIIVLPTVSEPSNSVIISNDSSPVQNDLVSVSNPVIECISHSDSDDSTVVMVKYIKPPNERTPEIVNLIGSDSDDVIIEEPCLTDTPVASCSSNQASGSKTEILPVSPRFQNLPSTSGLGQYKQNNTKRMLSDSETDSDIDSRPMDHKKIKYFKSRLLKRYKSTTKKLSEMSSTSDSSIDSSSPQRLTKLPDTRCMVSSDSSMDTPSDILHKYMTSSLYSHNINMENNNQPLTNSSTSSSCNYIRKKSKSIKKSKHKKSRRKSLDSHINKKHKHKSKSKRRSRSRDLSVEDKHSSRKKDHKKAKIRDQHKESSHVQHLAYWPRSSLHEASSSTSQSKTDRKIIKSVVLQKKSNDSTPTCSDRPLANNTMPANDSENEQSDNNDFS